MVISTSIITILAAVGATNALPNEKRITHDGIGSVNPNPTGALGSCGVSSPDSSMTVAMITNTGPTTDNSVGGTGNTIIVTVQDTCAGCDENHVDLSVAAWNLLTNGHEFSVTGVSWHFCNVNGQC
ncbi:hypothetical protein V496_00773 [Pseudogymnoascus sp. VKM F-4515 (FW-2607)]